MEANVNTVDLVPHTNYAERYSGLSPCEMQAFPRIQWRSGPP